MVFRHHVAAPDRCRSSRGAREPCGRPCRSCVRYPPAPCGTPVACSLHALLGHHVAAPGTCRSSRGFLGTMWQTLIRAGLRRGLGHHVADLVGAVLRDPRAPCGRPGRCSSSRLLGHHVAALVGAGLHVVLGNHVAALIRASLRAPRGPCGRPYRSGRNPRAPCGSTDSVQVFTWCSGTMWQTCVGAGLLAGSREPCGSRCRCRSWFCSPHHMADLIGALLDDRLMHVLHAVDRLLLDFRNPGALAHLRRRALHFHLWQQPG